MKEKEVEVEKEEEKVLVGLVPTLLSSLFSSRRQRRRCFKWIGLMQFAGRPWGALSALLVGRGRRRRRRPSCQSDAFPFVERASPYTRRSEEKKEEGAEEESLCPASLQCLQCSSVSKEQLHDPYRRHRAAGLV